MASSFRASFVRPTTNAFSRHGESRRGAQPHTVLGPVAAVDCGAAWHLSCLKHIAVNSVGQSRGKVVVCPLRRQNYVKTVFFSVEKCCFLSSLAYIRIRKSEMV